MARRNDHTKDQLKYLVLQSATGIIKDEGFAELSTRKIANEIGYAPGTLYNVFKNSDDIILHINSQTMLEIMEIFIKKREDNSIESFEALISEYLKYIENNYKIWSCLFEYKQSGASSLPEWYTENLGFIISAIEKYISYRFINKSDCRFNAELIWNSVNGICFMGMTSASKNNDFGKIKELCRAIITNCLK